MLPKNTRVISIRNDRYRSDIALTPELLDLPSNNLKRLMKLIVTSSENDDAAYDLTEHMADRLSAYPDEIKHLQQEYQDVYLPMYESEKKIAPARGSLACTQAKRSLNRCLQDIKTAQRRQSKLQKLYDYWQSLKP